MQFKPRFESYKVIESHHIVTDDTGNEMRLTLVECKLPSTNEYIIVSPYRFWAVLGKNTERWQNGAISHNSNAYWRGYERKLISVVINDILVQEHIGGDHYVFSKGLTREPNSSGVSSYFTVTPIEK